MSDHRRTVHRDIVLGGDGDWFTIRGIECEVCGNPWPCPWADAPLPRTLPTDRFTVIRVTWVDPEMLPVVLCLDEYGAWCDIQTTEEFTPTALATDEWIKDIEILARPAESHP